MTLRVDDPVRRVRGIGPRRAEVLGAAGIATVEDLLLWLPFRYEDRSGIRPVAELEPGRADVVQATVANRRMVRRPRGRSRVEATVEDDSGKLSVVWFRQAYIYDRLEPGRTVWLYGKVREHAGRHQMANPVVEEPGGQEGGIHIGGKVPIYRRIGDLGPAMIRRLIAQALEQLGEVEETLPPEARERLRLSSRDAALRRVHRPATAADVHVWNAGRSAPHRRLVVEEFLGFQAAMLMQRAGNRRAMGFRMGSNRDVLRRAVAALPFELTAGQQGALEQIFDDLRRAGPMHRLLHGDVGSGKTAVAGIAMLVAALSEHQAALMAPTEILAEQQAATLAGWAREVGLGVGCLTSGRDPTERRETLARLRDGDLRLVVGTHALIEPDVKFHRLGLVVIDEQHRFGVRQRSALRDKGFVAESGSHRSEHAAHEMSTSRAGSAPAHEGRWPDLLVMTATPIPRSLALTVFGDLETCPIEGQPPGRHPIRTWVCSERAWPDVRRVVAETVVRGDQAFVVAPRIEIDEARGVSTAPELADELRRTLPAELSRATKAASTKTPAPAFEVGLLHGDLDAASKRAAMADFVSGRTPVLVATTVVEVGVDVPAATLMVVDHAERFGLAQLHQLRGRVGRGEGEARCILIAHHPLTPTAEARLRAIKDTDDGWVLAERDLELRGPGELLGTRQAGLAGLRVGDPFGDHRWLEEAREEARRLLDDQSPEAQAWARRVESAWRLRVAVAGAG